MKNILLWLHLFAALVVEALHDFTYRALYRMGAVSYACDPFDAMKTATESLADKIYRKASPTSLWMSAVPLGTYKQGSGVVQTTFTIANSEPVTDTETWTNVTLDGTTLAPGCDVTYDQVDVGFTERTYGPRKRALKGPVICKDNLTYHHQARAFLAAYEQELGKRAKRTWEFELRRRYIAFSQKVIAGPDLTPLDSEGFGTTAPTSEMTMGILDVIAGYLIDGDATEPDSNGYVTVGPDGPLFTLYAGVEAISRIFTIDPELRQDARYSAPSELFKRVGATRTVKNFRMAPTTIPPRYNMVDGAIVQVPTFIMVDTTQGKRAVRNPDWINAEFEAAVVVLPTVFTAEIVQHITSAGKTINFGGESKYMGDWTFVTGAHKLGIDCIDPKEKLGQHFAEFEYAPKPVFPEHGFTLLFRRCPADVTLSTCTVEEEPET